MKKININSISNLHVFSMFLVITCLMFSYDILAGYSWDDSLHLQENVHYQSNKFSDLVYFWKQGYFGLYIPVTYTLWGTLLFTLNQLFGLDFSSVAPYLHGLNIVLFSLNTFLLFLTFQIFLKRDWSICAALIYLLHPLNTETVIWIAEFRILLSNFWAFLGIYLVIKGASKRNLWLSSLMLLLAVLSKPSAIVYLIILCLFGYTGFKKKLAWFFWSTITFLTSMSPVIYTKILQSNESPNYSKNISMKIMVIIDSYSFYISKFFVPMGYHHIYGRTPDEIDFHSFSLNLAISILVLLGVGWHFRWSKSFFISLLFLLALLSINSGIVSFAFQNFSTVANRYGSLGLPIMIFWMVRISQTHRWSYYVLIPWIVLSTYQSILQIYHWKDQSLLWQNEAKLNPHLESVNNQWFLMSGYQSKKLGIAYLNFLKRPQSQDVVSNMLDQYITLSDLKIAKDYLEQNKAKIQSDSITQKFESVIEFDSENYRKALELLDQALGGVFVTPGDCVQFYTYLLYYKGKEEVLEKLNHCPYSSEYGPLKAFKDEVISLKSSFPIQKRQHNNIPMDSVSWGFLKKLQNPATSLDSLILNMSEYHGHLHPKLYRQFIRETLKRKNKVLFEVGYNSYTYYFKDAQPELLMGAAKMYYELGDYEESYLRLLAVIALNNNLKSEASQLIVSILPLIDNLFYLDPAK